MDGMMMGVFGTMVGASAVGVVGAVRSIAEMWYPGISANSERKHQMIATVQAQRAEAIHRWRTGLAGARDNYRQWADGPHDTEPPNSEPPNSEPPNVVGDEWFEGLRPHLPSAGDAAQFRTAQRVNCDNATVVLLSLEIGRVEQQWIDEAHSGPPKRTRNRRG
jgi:hypothetical protein